MARYTGAQVGVWNVGGYNLLPYTVDVSADAEADIEETHTLGDAWRGVEAVGLSRFNLAMNGFYDDAALASAAAVDGSEGATRVAVLNLTGNTLGNKFIGFEGAVQQKTTKTVSRGALHKINIGFAGSGRKEEGVILLPYGQQTGTSGSGTGVDAGALSSNGAALYTVINETAGNVVVKLQHSTTDSSYVDLITATTVTTATDPSAERKTGGTTVNRWTRVTWTNSVSPFTGFAGFVRL